MSRPGPPDRYTKVAISITNHDPQPTTTHFPLGDLAYSHQTIIDVNRCEMSVKNTVTSLNNMGITHHLVLLCFSDIGKKKILLYPSTSLNYSKHNNILYKVHSKRKRPKLIKREKKN
jgi:hypothetical protein